MGLLPACNDVMLICRHAGIERTEKQVKEFVEIEGLEATGGWRMKEETRFQRL